MRAGHLHARFSLIAAALLLWCAAAAHAQPAPMPADPLRASLVTYGPGDAIYEKFGHNAIWLHDRSQSPDWQDLSFNYGLFGFDSTFIFRFIQKDLRYSLGALRHFPSFAVYREANRSVRVQDLQLSQSQLVALREFLYWNAREENAAYRYDYYRDNCSTRVRDALDRATGGQLRMQTQALTGRTYRGETRRMLHDDGMTMIGIDFLLGPGGDRNLTQWEMMFLPDFMAAALPQIISEGRSLVRADTVEHLATRPHPPAQPPHPLGRYLLLALAAILPMGVFHVWRRPRLLRATIVAWCIFTGCAGALLLYLMCFTAHSAAYWNINFLHASPLALLVALSAGHTLRGESRFASHVALVIVLLSALTALATLLLPGVLPQRNLPLVAWLLPVNTAMTIIMWRWQAPKPTAAVTE
jgi:hypothetical protein